jgi:hypothetical protein
MNHRIAHSFHDIKAHVMGQPPVQHNLSVFIDGVLFDNAEWSKQGQHWGLSE